MGEDKILTAVIIEEFFYFPDSKEDHLGCAISTFAIGQPG
jgi:hypothetical protein